MSPKTEIERKREKERRERERKREKEREEKERKRKIEERAKQILILKRRVYEKLLYSQLCSDIIFSCSDGCVIHAHRNILVTSSEYFSTMLSSSFKESADSTIDVDYPEDAVKCLLRFLYIGELANGSIQTHKFALLDMAFCYMLPNLQDMAMDYVVKSLTDDSLKDTLVASSLYSNDMAKQACFKYIKDHATTVLTRMDIVSIATDDPSLWSELSESIKGNITAHVSKSDKFVPSTAGSQLYKDQSNADVSFECSDGDVVFCHKNILAASSEVFEEIFESAKHDVSTDVYTISVSHTAEAVRAMLQFLYLCEFDKAVMKQRGLEILSLSVTYKLAPLQDLCMDCIVASLSKETFREVILAAYLHSIQLLKMTCFHFVRNHALQVLTRLDVISIATEYPTLWADLAETVQEYIPDYVSQSILS